MSETKGEYKAGETLVQYPGESEAITKILEKYNYCILDMAKDFIKLQEDFKSALVEIAYLFQILDYIKSGTKPLSEQLK